MTKAELIQAIKDYPDDMQVLVKPALVNGYYEITGVDDLYIDTVTHKTSKLIRDLNRGINNRTYAIVARAIIKF